MWRDGVIAAVLLFWAVGAYNRLVRLRSEAKAAFTALEAELQKQVQLVLACIPPEEDQPPSQFTGGSAFWGGLQGAAAQLAASLIFGESPPSDLAGYGVAPLKDKSIGEQIRFATEYLAARVKRAGGVAAGLAGYGEGAKYANQVMSRLGVGPAVQAAAPAPVPAQPPAS